MTSFRVIGVKRELLFFTRGASWATPVIISILRSASLCCNYTTANKERPATSWVYNLSLAAGQKQTLQGLAGRINSVTFTVYDVVKTCEICGILIRLTPDFDSS